MSGYSFLTDCSGFAQAQVIKSYLESQGFHPKVRDEQMRTVAPHLTHLLGRLIIEVPENEFLDASHSLEKLEAEHRLQVVSNVDQDTEELTYNQSISKKCLICAILGCIFIPILCGIYSMILGYRVLKNERPLSAISRRRVFLAIIFNSIGFYFWLGWGAKVFFRS